MRSTVGSVLMLASMLPLTVSSCQDPIEDGLKARGPAGPANPRRAPPTNATAADAAEPERQPADAVAAGEPQRLNKKEPAAVAAQPTVTYVTDCSHSVQKLRWLEKKRDRPRRLNALEAAIHRSLGAGTGTLELCGFGAEVECLAADKTQSLTDICPRTGIFAYAKKGSEPQRASRQTDLRRALEFALLRARGPASLGLVLTDGFPWASARGWDYDEKASCDDVPPTAIAEHYPIGELGGHIAGSGRSVYFVSFQNVERPGAYHLCRSGADAPARTHAMLLIVVGDAGGAARRLVGRLQNEAAVFEPTVVEIAGQDDGDAPSVAFTEASYSTSGNASASPVDVVPVKTSDPSAPRQFELEWPLTDGLAHQSAVAMHFRVTSSQAPAWTVVGPRRKWSAPTVRPSGVVAELFALQLEQWLAQPAPSPGEAQAARSCRELSKLRGQYERAVDLAAALGWSERGKASHTCRRVIDDLEPRLGCLPAAQHSDGDSSERLVVVPYACREAGPSGAEHRLQLVTSGGLPDEDAYHVATSSALGSLAHHDHPGPTSIFGLRHVVGAIALATYRLARRHGATIDRALVDVRFRSASGGRP